MLHTERHKYLILLTGENPTNIANDAHGFKKCVATQIIICRKMIVQILFYSELILGAGKICKYKSYFPL